MSCFWICSGNTGSTAALSTDEDMSRLLIYISETEKFDEHLVHDFLKSCPGVSAIQERPDELARWMAEFEFENDSALFECKSDLETVVVSRTGGAGIQLCYLFQAFYPKPLHVIDESYSFDLVIRDFGTVVELEKAMVAAMNESAGGAA